MLLTGLRHTSRRSILYSKLQSSCTCRHSSTNLLPRADTRVEPPSPFVGSSAEVTTVASTVEGVTMEPSYPFSGPSVNSLNTGQPFLNDSTFTQQSKLQATKKVAKTRTSKKKRANFFQVLPPPSQKIETYLHKLEAGPKSLTLDDVEKLRPRQVTNAWSCEYEKDYNTIADHLIRSFNLSQLKNIYNLYSIASNPSSLQRKNSYVEGILRHWGWKPISEVKEDISDKTTTTEMNFPLTKEEAFLLMGKEGAELLNLAKRYSVHLSFTEHPLKLRAKGLQGSLKRLQGYIGSFKKDIEVEITSLPLNNTLPFETAKIISRLSGAHLISDDTKLRITFHKSQPHTSYVARRLAAQALYEMLKDSTQPVVLENDLSVHSGQSGSSRKYSLYPFTPNQQIAWQFSPLSSFRLRRVANSLDISHKRSLENRPITPFDSMTELRSRLMSHVSDPSASNIEISACTGHFLFLTPSRPQTFQPSISGQQNISDILEWIKQSPKNASFNYSIPLTILPLSAYRNRHLRRLVYVEQLEGGSGRDLARTLQLEILSNPTSVESNIGATTTESAVKCYISTTSGINLIMPERHMDLQLSAAQTQHVPLQDIPRELSNFVTIGEADGEIAPLFLMFGSKYVLSSDERIHREFKTVSVSSKDINFVTETSTDMDINRHRTVCKVICDNYQSQESWNSFLNTCNNISTLT